MSSQMLKHYASVIYTHLCFLFNISQCYNEAFHDLLYYTNTDKGVGGGHSGGGSKDIYSPALTFYQ